MYNQKLVASLKANGKILREFKDTVYIPFGSEYSFLIKNLNTTRALVNIFIDGDNIVEGGLVINAGQEINLERAIRNNNLKEGNKFKFIERTSAVEQHRGAKLEDGLVRIEFQFEKPPMRINELPDWQKNQIFAGIRNGTINAVGAMGSSEYKGTTDKFTLTASGSVSQMNVGGVMRGIDTSQNGNAAFASATATVNSYCAQNGIVSKSEVHDGMATMDCSFNDIGITVPGSKSTQSFSTTYMGAMEDEKHTIVLKLLGETPDNKPVVKPVTVERKPKCVTCGKQNKAHAKFCTECGTALEIFA
ncbi:Zinc-ribbon domain containing protein [uncultured Caudovirales phage]|uniref:Zinc-ribbon domain containing protein n=1 Tax=uncultured Caudovirales phage TaxID=2100421 RepID=A0A6J5TD58_9CAUD|nr:Zinc-ribbon domain containing protein [uncultured Caudovirales phage]